MSKVFEKRQKLKEIDSAIRGEYLLTIAYLEQRINQILGDYFCKEKEKKIRLTDLILTSKGMTFSIKLEVLEKIVKEKFPDYYKDRKSIFNTMNNLRDFRNKLAHNPPELRLSEIDKRNEDEIIILTFENGETIQHTHKISDIKKKIGTAAALMIADLPNLNKLVKE